MELDSFRVQNYKKIRDTGWISCRDLTVFVGKNESGKSAIFRGLSKLNPSDGEKYDGLREFPRRRYTDEFARHDWPVASGRFRLTTSERDALARLSPLLGDVERVEVTRFYSWQLAISFLPGPMMKPFTLGELRTEIDSAIRKVRELSAPEGKGAEVVNLKQGAIAGLEKAKQSVAGEGTATKSQVEQALNAVLVHSNEPWQKTLLEPVAASLSALAEQVGAEEKLAEARKWVESNLPQFVYFDRYDVIDSAIHIPTFTQQLNTNPKGARVRVTSCLFRHVGLDLNRLASLGRHAPGHPEEARIRREIDERAILASSASAAMTQKFTDWWEQRKHKFRYQLDGDYFRVWVSDDLDPSEIELDQRSAGMQYFFSFYTVFTVESEGAHTNSILLLDDPGLYLHGTAQAKVVEFLEKLSKDNQLLYTTHSPFMVDVDHLERARAVYEDSDGTTKVSEDVWPRDSDSLFPLQAALGYQLAQSLFISKRQLIVEGITDLWLLKALDYALGVLGRARLRQDIVIVPSAGLSKLFPLASMLVGHNIQVAALLDGDEPGRREGKKLTEKLLSGKDRRCLFIGDFLTKKDAELEDIFPEEEYLAAVEEAYPGVSLDFTADEKSIHSVVDRVGRLFERKGLGPFEKWKAAAILRDHIIESPEKANATILDIASRIFEGVNALLTPTGEG